MADIKNFGKKTFPKGAKAKGGKVAGKVDFGAFGKGKKKAKGKEAKGGGGGSFLDKIKGLASAAKK